MRRSNFALWLAPSLMEEARKAASSEGVALNQLINIAVVEKVSTLRTVDYFRERARRANRPETLRILARAGKGNPPREGVEFPLDWELEGEIERPSRNTASPGGSSKTRRKKASL